MSDLKRVYVVEVQPTDAVPSTTVGDSRWLSVHTTDSQDDAIRVAQEETGSRGHNARVRQFWVESNAPEPKPLKPGQPVPTDVPMTAYTCLDHRDRVISVHATARPPRCPDCKTNMVPQTMALDMDKELSAAEPGAKP